jgi:hypothetical protein
MGILFAIILIAGNAVSIYNLHWWTTTYQEPTKKSSGSESYYMSPLMPYFMVMPVLTIFGLLVLLIKWMWF